MIRIRESLINEGRGKWDNGFETAFRAEYPTKSYVVGPDKSTSKVGTVHDLGSNKYQVTFWDNNRADDIKSPLAKVYNSLRDAEKAVERFFSS